MNRSTSRRLASLALIALACAPLGACVTPFSEHAKDIGEAVSDQAREAHRKYDRYFWNLDWDDPNHVWHDESYASGPGHH